MKMSLKSHVMTRTRRLKRHTPEMLQEAGRGLGLLGVILGATAVVAYLVCFTISSPFFALKETRVKGCKEITEKDVLSLAALRPNQSILALNRGALSERIKKNPWVRDVFIGRELPDRLVIEVKERKAVAVLKRGGAFYLLDEAGAAFKKVETAEEADLPVLTGYVSEGRLDARLLRTTLDLLQKLAAAKTFPTAQQVSEVHGNEYLGLLLYTSRGLCLNLGFDNYEGKLQKLTPVMADLERRNVKLTFCTIDLSDPAKVTVQRRNIQGTPEPAGASKGFRL